MTVRAAVLVLARVPMAVAQRLPQPRPWGRQWGRSLRPLEPLALDRLQGDLPKREDFNGGGGCDGGGRM